MSELTTVNAAQVMPTANQSMASRIVEMASDPNFDVEKLEKLMDLEERNTTRLAKVAFNESFAEMQSQIPTVAKSKKGNGSSYATLEDVVEITRPILNKHGFSTYFNTKTNMGDSRKAPKDGFINDGNVEVTAILLHEMGHQVETSLVVPFDFSGSKNSNTAQAMGSAVSYGKRYALCALLNIATRDDNDAQTSNVYAHKTITGAQARRLQSKYDQLDEANKVIFDNWITTDYGIDSIDQVKLVTHNNIDSGLARLIGKQQEVETA